MDTARVLAAAETFSRLLRELNEQRGLVEAEVEELTRESSAIEHKFDRKDCLYKERARLATQLAGARRRRRELKDWLRANEPYFNCLRGADGAKLQSMVSSFVGVGRKAAMRSAASGKGRAVEGEAV